MWPCSTSACPTSTAMNSPGDSAASTGRVSCSSSSRPTPGTTTGGGHTKPTSTTTSPSHSITRSSWTCWHDTFEAHACPYNQPPTLCEIAPLILPDRLPVPPRSYAGDNYLYL